MPHLAALRAAAFKLFAKNRWGQDLPPSSARVNAYFVRWADSPPPPEISKNTGRSDKR